MEKLNIKNSILELKDLLIRSGSTMLETLRLIDNNGQGISFVVSEGNKLLGTITDGDIRRSLLNGANLSAPVDKIMNINYYSLAPDTPMNKIQISLSTYHCIPIVDNRGVVIEFASREHFGMIPISKPDLTGNELSYVTDCILSGWISSQGSYVKKFEDEFNSFVNASLFPVSCSNGTTALHLALLALGIGPGDEVIVPNLSFAATINPIIHVGATPVLVEVDILTMGLDIELVKKNINKRTKCIIAVHLYGYPTDVVSLLKIGKQNNIFIVEDCAEAIGTISNGVHVGTYCDASTFSFFGNKTITSGEGGIVLFKNKKIFNRAKLFRDHGMNPNRRYWHEVPGFNFRLTNLQAAVALAQLERVEDFVKRKREIASQYNLLLKDQKKLKLPSDPPYDGKNSFWLYTIIVKDLSKGELAKIIETLSMQGVESRPIFYPFHLQPIYRNYRIPDMDYSRSEYLSQCGLSLPSSTLIKTNEIERVCELLIKALDNLK